MTAVTAAFLDAQQYSRASIEAYEAVFGQDFLSPGGQQTAAALIEALGLAPGQRVLDVGCGLGGSAFLMAREHGLYVDGIDLSANMVELARQRLARYRLEGQVRLEHGDCLALDRPGQYDAVYSRDVFLHIHAKEALLTTLKRCLRPGGVLLFTDYCATTSPWSEAFSDYVARRGYHLISVASYRAAVAAAGFTGVTVEDRSDGFLTILQRELQAIPDSALPVATRTALRASWIEKIDRVRRGEQRWLYLRALRP